MSERRVRRRFYWALLFLFPVSLHAAENVSNWRERLGEAAVASLLRAKAGEERRRGMERLALPFSRESRERLLSWVERVEELSLDEKRTLVFAIARFANEPKVANLLYRVLSDVAGNNALLGPQIQTSAALALSRAQSPQATAFLISALGHAGPLAEFAKHALLTHPPRDVRVLCSKQAPPGAVALVGEIGDKRAIPALRELVRKAPMDVSVEAAVALAKLGNFEPLALAREWAKSSLPKLRARAAEILALLAPLEATGVVEELLGQDGNVDLGLRLARQVLSPRLIDGLGRLLTTSDSARADSARQILAAIEAQSAGAKLVSLARTRSELSLAAHALATATSSASGRTLTANLARAGGWDKRLWQHAWRLRYAKTDDELGSLGKAGVPSGFSSEEACRLAVAGADNARRLNVQLIGCLRYPEIGKLVSSESLVNHLQDSVAAPMAALVLASRYAPQDSLSEQLLKSADTDVRAAALFGLSRCAWPLRFGMLTQAFATESEPEVRRAIVTGIGLQARAWSKAWLSDVAALDSDPGVRQAAKQALTPHSAWPTASGVLPVWIFVDGNTQGQALGVRLFPGLVVPMLPDPDGFVVVPHAVTGSYSVRLALAPEFDHVRPPSTATEAHEQTR